MHGVRDTGRRRALRLGGTVLAAGLAGCSNLPGAPDSGSSTLTPVRVVLNWKPNPTQAGYFVALDRGFYAEEGLDVTLVPGKGGSFATKQVGLGNATLGLGSGVSVLQARANALPVRSYAAAQQSSNAALFSVREAFGGELSRVSQLEGTRIAVVSGSAKTTAYLESLLVAEGIRETVEFVTVGVEQQTSNLLAGNVDVATGIFSNALALEQRGYDASLLLLGDYVPTVGRTVFARPSDAAEKPSAVEGFLRATARGWLAAANDPPAAEDVLIDEKPSLATTRELGVAKIQFTADHLLTSDAVAEHCWGWQSPETWQAVHDALSAADVLPDDVAVSAAWTNEYLDASAAPLGDFADRVTVAE